MESQNQATPSPPTGASAPGGEKTYRLPIRRPVTTAMLFLTLVVFGWKSYQELPINLMPDISYPTLTVRTEYEGAAPEDVEQLVTRPLEEMLSIVSGLSEVRSVSSPGLSEVVLEFTWGTDMNTAQQDVRDQLDLFDPPRGVTENPVILRFDPSLDPVMRIAIAGQPMEGPMTAEHRLELTAIREAAERHIKSDLEAELGIAQVRVKGGREEEVQVLADASRLKNMGLSLDDLSSSLSQQNINLSGGRLREGRTEYLVRTLNEFQTIAEIQSSLITLPGSGNPSGPRVLQLQDLATVQLGEKDRDTIVRLNGQEAVELEIFKEGDANTVQVCNTLKDLFGFDRPRGFLERMGQAMNQLRMAREGLDEDEQRRRELAQTLRGRLPDYAEVSIISDQSRFITGSIREVQQTAIAGGVMALIVLFFFLREFRATVIIGVAIPISVIATFVPMFMRDISLNIMSLGGLALGVGMLVDNSIVVLESIFRCKEEGDGTLDAAERGASEVSSAVTASTLTTIAVFLPIAFVEGVAGQLFRDQALTVTFSLIASLLVALLLIPMIASRRRLSATMEGGGVWPLRAYREARREEGVNPVSAAARIPFLGAGYAAQWLRETVAATFGPAWSTLTGKSRDAAEGGAAFAFRRSGALALMPVLILLFVLQVMLTGFIAVAVSVLFALAAAAALTGWSVAKLLGLLLWLPLKLFDLAFHSLREGYTVALRHALRFSPVILLIVLGLAVHAATIATSLGQELIPPLKQGEFGIRMEAPPGVRLEETERRAQRIEQLAIAMPEVETVTVEVGMEPQTAGGARGENLAQFNIQLRDPANAARHQDAIMERLRQQIAYVSSDDITFTLPTLFSFRTPIELQIRGDDPRQLREIGRRVLAAAADVPGLRDLELSMQEGYPEIIVDLDRSLLASYDLAPEQVANRLRNEILGEVPTRFDRAGERVDLRVRTARDELQSVRDLHALSVRDGHPPLPLSAVAEITVREGPSEIRRIDQRRVAVVSANVEGRDLGSVSQDLMNRVSQVERPRDYVFLLGGQNQELQVSYESLQFALLLAIFLVYVVMACQFESLWHPAFVMFSVPLAFIGVVHALNFMDINLSIVVFIGGIILAGIVVNNAIVLVDYINQLRARGLAKADAVVQAGRVRLRPILMTTLTTVLGLAPMALWSGEGAEMRQPMAVTVMAGLLTATLLTLFIIPMVYYLFAGRDAE